MINAFRIVKTRYADSAFDGEGARVYGGRFNSAGTAVAYAAASESLAILEILVHVDQASLLPSYSLCTAVFSEDLVENLDDNSLPEDWRDEPAPMDTQLLGDAWVRESQSPVLAVPSVIVPREKNYLLNPAHQDFDLVRLSAPEPFSFDSRLANPLGGTDS